jgi:hypothetical protein
MKSILTPIGTSLTISGDLAFQIPIYPPFEKRPTTGTPDDDGDYETPDSTPSNLNLREQITKFTESSGRRMTRFLRECTADYKTMITLTYGKTGGTDGRACKEDLRRFTQRLERSEYWQEDATIFWFLEFQKRGAVHFHLFTTLQFIPYQWVAENWTDIVYRNCKANDSYSDELLQREMICHRASGTRTERIKKGRGGVISYARKYAKKQYQKVLPKGFGWCGRFWGIKGNRERDKAANIKILFDDIPEALDIVKSEVLNLEAKILESFDKLELITRKDISLFLYINIFKLPTNLIYKFINEIKRLKELRELIKPPEPIAI